jgi:hypothetical protein
MDAQRSLWSSLWSQPAGPHSRLRRYTVANGVLYLAAGAAIHLLPAEVLTRLFFLGALTGREEGLLRAIGVLTAAVGWFYALGGRTRADSFGLATVVDRMLIPLLLVPRWLLGMAPPGLVLPFSILDPLLSKLRSAPAKGGL